MEQKKKERLDALYICTTPLQIMAAVSMCVNFRERADLYIDPQFEGAAELGERVRKEGVFDRVRVLDSVGVIDEVRNTADKKKRALKILRMYRKIDRAAEEILIPGRSYRKLYASHYVFVAGILITYFSKRKMLTRVCFFEDGEGSYDNRDALKLGTMDRVARRVLALGTKPFRKCRKYYMYSPELFRAMRPEIKAPVAQLPRFNRDERIMEMIRRIFQITPDKGIREPLIILDCLKEKVLSPEDDARIVKLYDHIKERFGDRVIVKRHPRDTRKYETVMKEYSDLSTPFEVICLASEPENMVLITLLSTATIMPKLLMDAEPRVILLYHLYHRLEGDDADRDHFFELTRKTCRDPERFAIPDTEEELERILDQALLEIREREERTADE